MAKFRRLAKQDKHQPKKQEFVFDPEQKDPHPKPEPAKAKIRRPAFMK